MIVTAVPQRGVDIDTDAFGSITAVPVTGLWWQGEQLAVEFAGDLTPMEQASVRRRIQSRNSNEEELRRLAEQALQSNRDYRAIASPTQAQAAAQIKAVTAQLNGIIRLLLGQLDGTD